PGVGARLAGPRGPPPGSAPAAAAPRRHPATGPGRPARPRPRRLAVRLPAAPRGGGAAAARGAAGRTARRLRLGGPARPGRDGHPEPDRVHPLTADTRPDG